MSSSRYLPTSFIMSVVYHLLCLQFLFSFVLLLRRYRTTTLEHIHEHEDRFSRPKPLEILGVIPYLAPIGQLLERNSLESYIWDRRLAIHAEEMHRPPFSLFVPATDAVVVGHVIHTRVLAGFSLTWRVARLGG